ncbi:hypothetical protein NT2_02_00270 [Caenibius tardaugens NBRC 16725]|uniref:Hpt domain-containing protein n=1 Tax=Caenibius tardaugens NBRC 16725 TaxID=1219035 RepID=U2ZRF5_9SPHN|nr:hypothetical protein [Caenibius tardaugens]AZI37973.1 Hpt domain-containing protein [Caenibius tardaugens NBRC 16725]GAD47944.1 hypothetical protein NT2_02_00270 [Caenibius tardaugens NBRC 16725]
MAFENSALDATLAAAAGDDACLLRELREAFGSSLAHHVDLLSRARCDGNWEVAAMRIKGLAASFQVQSLISLAEDALVTVPGDPAIIRKFRAALEEFSAGLA